VAHAFFKRHRELLDKAVQAIATCGYWSPYSESPSLRVYGETAAEGKAAFEARLNRSFALEQPGTVGRTGKGVSPYGMLLGIPPSSPRVSV
jgi:hypothetical protein